MRPHIDVLVVDDDPGVARLLVTALRRAGWSVEQAEDAESALACLDRLEPRLLISDRTLPGRDGLELLAAVEAAGHTPAFLLMSAWMPEELRLKVLDDPAVAGLLDKPFDLDRLEQDVRAALGGARLAALAPRSSATAAEGLPSQVSALSGSGLPNPNPGPPAPSPGQAWFPGASLGCPPDVSQLPVPERPSD